MAALMAALVVACSPQIPQGSALETPGGHGWETQQKVGTVFTDGFETLDVVSEPVQVIDVRFEGGDPGLELIGYEIVPPPRHYATIQLLPGFPPTPRELPKARAQPGESLVTDPNGRATSSSWTSRSPRRVVGSRLSSHQHSLRHQVLDCDQQGLADGEWTCSPMYSSEAVTSSLAAQPG